jgi:MFS family permease
MLVQCCNLHDKVRSIILRFSLNSPIMFILLTTFTLMLLTPYIASRFINLPRNVVLLFWVQPLVLAPTSVIVLVGGLIGIKIAPDPAYATLPLALMIIGTAVSSIPTAFILKKLGRKKGTYVGFVVSLLAAIVGIFATQQANFLLLLITAVLFGISIAFVLQLRFAAMESVDNIKDVPNALSFLMIGGVFSAFLGPEVAVLAKDWINSPHGYAGSFLALAILNLIAMVIFSGYKNTQPEQQQSLQPNRSLNQIIAQPVFLVAVLSAAIAYGVMSFVMTATPLSMFEVSRLSLENTKWVIQSHIAAMYLPSFFVGALINRFGLKTILAIGTLIYAGMVVIALSGQQLMHYWWALVLLGIGWNFLFTSGTVLLNSSYRPNEKHKIQAVNDFIVFGIQAIASLSAGWLLYNYGWNTIAFTTIPAIAVMLLALVWYHQYSK